MLALIAGPTASGKSALALDLARRWNGTIINADSAQVYADLRVLSARPTPAEEAQVPHRLFGYVDGAQPYSAAAWAHDARAAIAECRRHHRLPLFVGGTGLYLRTLLDGIAPVPDIDPAIRDEVRALPVDMAHAMLSRDDPAAAARLNPADTTRVARALEVVRSTGRPLADWQAERVGGIGRDVTLAPLILLPPRQWLFERCDARFSGMLEDGAIDEVRALLARTDIAASAQVRRAIGVAQIDRLLNGLDDGMTAMQAAQLATRQYAKRQYTWFRNQSPPDWLRSEKTETCVLSNIFERKFLQ